MKKGVVPPLFQREMHPGEAVEESMKFEHPYTSQVELPEDLQYAVDRLVQWKDRMSSYRKQRLKYWKWRSKVLKKESLQQIEEHEDELIKKLFRKDGIHGDKPREVGEFFHIALLQEMATFAEVQDEKYVKELWDGLKIVGKVQTSGRWTPFEGEPGLSLDELDRRHMEFRNKVKHMVRKNGVDKHTEKLWEDTVKDVQMGYTVGPIYSEEEVSKIVGTDRWIPTMRFGVEQKSKTRGIDTAKSNGVNAATEVVEKMSLPTTDYNMGVIKAVHQGVPDAELAAWVLDERSAYRQIPVHPSHRRYSVVCMMDPKTGELAYFIMVGHSFGLVSAVYNYNRRASLLTELLRKLFLVPALNYYDDKYGFDLKEFIEETITLVADFHWMLGVEFDTKKVQSGQVVKILGVRYNLKELLVDIDEERRMELIEDIIRVLKLDLLEPGYAGKLKGKLQFAEGQLQGRVGRSLLRCLSERQYSRSFITSLTPPLRSCLRGWLMILHGFGKPRKIEMRGVATAEVIGYSDGWNPEGVPGEESSPRTGFVVYDKQVARPVYATKSVAWDVVERWIVRKNQIMMVELLAVVQMVATVGSKLRGRTFLVFVDSESAEGALVKGGSSKDDVSELVRVFWRLIQEFEIIVYIDRVPTDSNISDGVSRNSLVLAKKLGWVEVEIPEFMEWASGWLGPG